VTVKLEGVVRWAIVGGVTCVLAAGCASTTSQTEKPPAAREAAGGAAGGEVVIQVEADCKVDVEEAHISESKNEQAHWRLAGDPGPLVIEFKEEKGRNALHLESPSSTAVKARIKLAKQQGSHPYRIRIGERECPDPLLIIDP
jgi:hypothetical protein